MSDRRGSLFVDQAPDSAAPPRPVPAPVSNSEVQGAHWTLSRQSLMGGDVQAENDAYSPILAELNKSDDRNLLSKIFVPMPYENIDTRNGAGLINKDKVWAEVERRRAINPDFFKDVPARNADEFSAWVKQQELGRRHAAQDVISRQHGLVQGAIGLGTDIGGSFADPVNLATLPLGGGAKTIFGTMARDALLNGVLETAELPITAQIQGQYGEHMTPGEAAQDVLTAAAGGAVFGGALHVGGKVIGKGIDAALNTDMGRAAALAAQPLPKVTPDEVVAAAFRDHVPAEIRTPDQQAALHVIDRQGEVDATSPFKPTPAGMDAHADNLDAAMRTVAGAIDPDAPIPPAIPRRGTLPSVSRGTAAPGAAPDLSPDRIVRFVQNDLEGGATVVHFSQADGGTTKYGIAQAANPGVDVASLTADQAAAIAHRKYWLPEFDHVDPRIAAVGFDAGYISGPETARRILRESGGDPMKAIELYREHLNHIADTVPGKEKFRKGWNNRVDKLAKLVGGDDRPVLRPEGFADDGELAASQSAIDHAEMDAQLAAHEAALATGSRQGELDFSASEPHAGAMEGSALPDRAGAVAEAAAPGAVPRETPDVPRATDTGQPAVIVSRETSPDVPREPGAPIAEAAPASEPAAAPSAPPVTDIASAAADRRVRLMDRARTANEPAKLLAIAAEHAPGMSQKAWLDDVLGTPDWVAAPKVTAEMAAQGIKRAVAPHELNPLRQLWEARNGWSDGRPPASQLSAAGDHAIGTADVTLAKEAAKGFDDPHGAAAKEQVEGLAHDIKQRLEAGELGAGHFATSGVELAGGDTAPIYQNAHAILAALDEEDAALAALRGCM